ncbi:histone deacetylase family protein [Elioraea rosea]|uniref:histone deacetylase family protein n=1 Tax=Elioraea rosea TaxID=2492390 RepID=UPI0011827E14|nr:histone deacetylase family protein [Elioraea rosea]
MSTVLFSHPACLGHDTGPGHPERADRIRAVLAALEAEEFAMLLREEAPEVSVETLARAHPRAYVEGILSIVPEPDERVMLDGDTVMSHGSRAAALRSAGAAVAAVDAVMEGWAHNAFCATRPPGHHAEAGRPMGFCLFSNAAVAAHHARAKWGAARVAVVDFDVHHGNGTQAILESDPGFFYASSHEMPLYPGTGDPSERGVANNVLNVALRSMSGGPEFRAAWGDEIIPAVEAFGPDLLIVSAGFDAHRRDPLASLTVTTADFSWLSHELVALAERACGGKLVSLLEGGYDLEGLAASAAAHVRALMRV